MARQTKKSDFGKIIRINNRQCFVASDPCRLITSDTARSLEHVAETFDFHKCDEVPSTERAVLFLVDSDANAFRSFPLAQLSNVLRDPECHKELFLSSVTCMRLTVKLWSALKSSRGCLEVPTALVLRVASSRCSDHSRKTLVRSKNVRFEPYANDSYSCLPPKRIEPYLRKLVATKAPNSFTQRIVAGFLLHLQFLLVHPFSDGNGRVSRSAFSALCSQGLKQPFPFSLPFFMQEGKYLYSSLTRSIAYGNLDGVCNYFERACRRTLDLAHTAINDSSDPNLDLEINEFISWQKKINRKQGDSLPLHAMPVAILRAADRLAPAIYCSQYGEI